MKTSLTVCGGLATPQEHEDDIDITGWKSIYPGEMDCGCIVRYKGVLWYWKLVDGMNILYNHV